MNILVDVGHPGHVHLFRNPIRNWTEHGHSVVVTIRERDIVGQLLEAYGIPYEVASKARHSVGGLFYELVEHDWQVLQRVQRYKSDVLLGTSVAAAHVSRITPAKSIVFNEDDDENVKLFAKLTYPFADAIVVPDFVRGQRTTRHVVYNSCHELAYLHPNHYQPDSSVLEELGVQPGEPYFILRLVALKAYHDVGQAGISPAMRRKLIELLSQHGRVFITVEGTLPEELRPYQIPMPPHRIHHAMAYSRLLVADSQTMTAEAAILGVPAIRCNTFVAKGVSLHDELEQKYGLTYGYLPSAEEKMLEKIQALLAMPDLAGEWQRRRMVYLNDKIDAAAWITQFVEEFAQRR
jgi:predicted glycosyltransferase